MGGAIGNQQHQLSFLSKIMKKFANFQLGQPPLRATLADILHFSAFCLHVMPSLLPFSPLLGPMVSILEHLCLPKTPLTQFWKETLNIKNTKTLLFVSQKVSSVSIVYF